MSDKKIQLSIFNPLGEYFKIMGDACGGISESCSNEKFKSIITNECDDISGNTGDKKKEVSKRFLNALDLFALNLKTFDSPISQITIKGTLYNIFNDKLKDNLIIVDGSKIKVNDKAKAIGDLVKGIGGLIKMDSQWGTDAQTYTENLKKHLDDEIDFGPRPRSSIDTDIKYKKYIKELEEAKKKELIELIFNKWLFEVFNIYGDNIKRFGDFIADIQSQYSSGLREFEPRHIEAFNLFFEIVSAKNARELVGAKNFWNSLLENLEKSSSGDVKVRNASIDFFGDLKKDTRINIKVMKDTTTLKDPYKKPSLNTTDLKAAIIRAFPHDMKNELNKKLMKGDSKKFNEDILNIGKINNKLYFYKIKEECIKGTYNFEPEQVEKIFGYIKNQNKYGYSGEIEIKDAKDIEKYNDGKSDEQSIDEIYDYVKKYKNTWARDEYGELYTKWNYKDDPDFDDNDPKFPDKFTKYSKDQLEKDMKSFRNKDGNCGHLCLFDNPTECEQFFKDMTDGKEVSYDKLAEIVNGKGFTNNYEVLKKNIVKVNPAFIIGTLKAFKFDKWEQFRRDGTKIIRVESFTRWWNRTGKEFMDHPPSPDSIKERIKDTSSKNYVKPHDNKDDDGKVTLNPSPPENLELFLKLLVSFINYNEWVLNPQKKNNILGNRLPKTSLEPHSSENEEFLSFIENGVRIQVPNGAWKKNKETNSNESIGFGTILDEIKKNTTYRPVESTMENRSVLNTLLATPFGWNSLGKLMLGKRYPNSTGRGRGYIGGSKDISSYDFDDNKVVKQYEDELEKTPCARTAFSALILARNNLKKTNKIFTEFDKLIQEVSKLAETESDLLESLIVISKYQKIINSLGDDSARDIGIKEMENEINDYKSMGSDVSSRADNLTVLISNLLNTPTSKYTKII